LTGLSSRARARSHARSDVVDGDQTIDEPRADIVRDMRIDGHVWELVSPKEPLRRVDRAFDTPAPGLALVQVLGCGVCHTDLGFADGDVAPRHALPLVLGHEIVGRVLEVGRATDEPLVGRRVLAPAVSPCGDCAACRRGRPTSCATGRMPGNDADGGFSTHTYVPSRDVCVLDDTPGVTGPIGAVQLAAWELAPIADAATTAYQAIVRAGLDEGDVAVFVGAGGVGGFGAQLAKAEGARVVAIDVDATRLSAVAHKCDLTIASQGRDARDVKKELGAFLSREGLGDAPLRVFETSGHPKGQELAFTLLARGGSLSIVGFTPEKVPLRLSNVMALDADVFGNWGADPALFPGVIERVLSGEVEVRPFVERCALDDVNEVLAAVRRHAMTRRPVLVPAGT
jgi:6-hydroxycyclohex-1-ene-1-carbonyl-CoA dehydrogenase